jgi:hypothetical protein
MHFKALMAKEVFQGGDGELRCPRTCTSSANINRIFVVEGLLTIFFSVFIFIFVPNFPVRDK